MKPTFEHQSTIKTQNSSYSKKTNINFIKQIEIPIFAGIFKDEKQYNFI